MFVGKQIEIGLAHEFGRIAEASALCQAGVGADKATVTVLEIDTVRQRVHQAAQLLFSARMRVNLLL